MEIKVTFNYLNRAIQIFCKDDEEMNSLFERFTNKLNDGSEATHYIYYHEGKKLGNAGTIGKNKHLAGKRDINITVTKKLRMVKCHECVSNDCIVNLSDYLVSFYGCKYNHVYSTIYDNYINIQKIDRAELKCQFNNCPNNQENYTLGIYKCLTCSNLVGESRYFCKDHLSEHSKHTYVKYDKKNYYCVTHSKPYKKYCFTHKKDLCEDCVGEHENDLIKGHELMVPNIEELKQSLTSMEEKMSNLQIIIDSIKTHLDGALRVFKRYLYIAKDIIGKYELFNNDLKNYKILRSLRNLQFSNIKMNNDLTKIIDEKDQIKRINYIIKIHLEKEENRKKNISNQKPDLNEDPDENWLKDILKKEKLKASGQKPQESHTTKTKSTTKPGKKP